MTAIAINPLAVSVAPTAAEFAPLVTRFAPTEHGGGGGLKKVVAVVAAVAIPFAAPAIASSIGLSAAIGAATTATVGSVVGSAIVGAGLGAVTAAVTGQPIKTGIIGGAIAGGIAGYFAAPQAAPTSTTSAPVSGPTQAPGTTDIASTSISTSGAPIAGPGQTYDAFGNIVPASGDAAATLTNATVSSPVAGADLGAQLSNTAVTPVGAPVAAPGATSVNYALTAPTATNASLGTGLTTNAAGVGLQAPAGAQLGTAGARAAADASFLSKVGSSIVAKVSNPDAVANLTLQAGAQLLGQALTPDPQMPPEQRQLLEERKAELAELKATNEEAFNQQMALAKEYLNQSQYYDPSYMAAQAANKALIEEQQRLREAERQAGLRSGTRELSASERQRMRINAARNVSSQFDTGFSRGVGLRDQALARATPPKGDASYYNALTNYAQTVADWNDTANERRNKQASNITEFFGGLASTKGNTQSEQDALDAALGRGLRAGLNTSGRIG